MPRKTVRQQWESQCKTYLFGAWTCPNHSGVIACNTPYYHQVSSLGQFLPKTTFASNQSIDINAIQGPICPHFVYKKSPIPFRKAQKDSLALPFPVFIDEYGFVFAKTDDD